MNHLQSLATKRFWIFDMDGTLTHAVHDFDAIRAELELPEGEPILEAIARLPEEEAARKSRQLDDLELKIAELATPQPGAVELLERLRERGATLGILTRNGKQIAAATLSAAGLDHFFPQPVVISRDCCAPKPDPAGVQRLLDYWTAPPTASVMVGDYLFDLQAGQRAGVTTIHFDESAEFAWPEYTDYRISNLNELCEALPR